MRSERPSRNECFEIVVAVKLEIRFLVKYFVAQRAIPKVPHPPAPVVDHRRRAAATLARRARVGSGELDQRFDILGHDRTKEGSDDRASGLLWQRRLERDKRRTYCSMLRERLKARRIRATTTKV